MKIIDLAEKQKNNETLPKHIRYEDEDLYFDGVTYCDKEGNNDVLDLLAMNNSALTHLYDEIEIIEESGKGPREWGAGPRGPGEKVRLRTASLPTGIVSV